MRRLLFTVLLCALGAAQASAQNRVSEQLFDLDDNERNEAFTFILRDNDRKCDQVVRTMFNGSVLGVDEWEALCRDRNSYSISVLSELEDTIVTVLSCRELSTTSKMLLHKAGSRSKAARCKVK
jgi:hypothetical protein